jgi:hypothetical protein
MFFETASAFEVGRRFRNGVFVTQIEVPGDSGDPEQSEADADRIGSTEASGSLAV